MVGSSAGIFSRAAVTTAVARSSGRTSFSDPLNARPIGLRAVETMTASGTVPPGVLQVSKRSAALPPTMLLRCQVRVGVGLVSSVARRLGVTGRHAGRQRGAAQRGTAQRGTAQRGTALQRGTVHQLAPVGDG